MKTIRRKMRIEHSESVALEISISDQMVEDWKECRRMAKVPGGPGKNCNTCSLDVDIDGGCGICEEGMVRDTLNHLADTDG